MSNPKQLITKEFAIDLCQRYINTRSQIITDTIGEDDANAIWFPLEELENYIAYVKSESAAKDYKVDGIRMYLGVYPTDASNQEKSEKTTIFLSPTGKKNNSTANPEQSPDISEIKPLNYGSLGNPPIIDYPL